jgi:hypothetical protein
MNISDYIKHSLDEADRGNLEAAMMHVCAAVDGTAKKLYHPSKKGGERFKKFIVDNIDIVQHLLGGFDLEKTIFPFSDQKDNVGVKIEDIIYNNYRCKLMHGDELGDGWGINVSIDMHLDKLSVDLKDKTMLLPQSKIYALGLPCVLSSVNSQQKIGNSEYFYKDPHHVFFVDDW